MEYGYALIMPAGFVEGVHTKVTKKLIEEGYNFGITTLISVSDFTETDLDKTINLAKKRNFNLKFKKFETTDSSVAVFVQGENAINKLKDIVLECDIKDEKGATCIYVSNSNEQAKEDLCDYIGIEDFSKIESLLFADIEKGTVTSFNFRVLSDMKTK